MTLNRFRESCTGYVPHRVSFPIFFERTHAAAGVHAPHLPPYANADPVGHAWGGTPLGPTPPPSMSSRGNSPSLDPYSRDVDIKILVVYRSQSQLSKFLPTLVILRFVPRYFVVAEVDAVPDCSVAIANYIFLGFSIHQNL